MNEIRQSYVMKNLTREAKLLSMLHHPCIVRLYETIQCGSVYYLVTELATGGDLCTHIKKQPLGRLNELTAKFYSRQLVAALEHMHSRGIIHRDLKIDNIMLQDARKERIKIVDFGLSNICNNNELLKTHCGSPEYAAPELFVEGKKYGPEVDLWSLGVVLYVMTSGRLPFVSPLDGHTPSEERRRKFMIQINRGLTALQEKSISAMSSEYKDVVNRLLMPIAHKRITIQELNLHPWIIDRQKTVIKVISEYNLDAVKHTEVLDKVANAACLDKSVLQISLSQKNFGEIGGMYNIIFHQMLRKNSNSNFSTRPKSVAKLSVKNSLISPTYDSVSSSDRRVNNNDSVRNLFPFREPLSPVPCITRARENLRNSINSPKLISGIIRREKHFGDHQKEYSRPQRRSTSLVPQGTRVIRHQISPPSMILRSETSAGGDLITQKRSQRLPAKEHALPSSSLFMRSGVKLLGRDDFVPESAAVGNRTCVFYKPVKHPQNPQAQLPQKAINALKTLKKENFQR